MKKFRFILLFISIAIFSAHFNRLLVESKAQLCQPPPKWTVNNGSDPMHDSLGNVTLVTLINASYKFGQKQASSLENMLRFLKKSGLKDIHFIVINSKDFDSKRKLKELSLKVSLSVYQENENELVWDVLDGGRDDMFIYDRCGHLTYYIPFPLSIIHAQQPILQAALLSTYFDNPCGESCDSLESDTIPTTSATTVATDVSPATPVTSRPDDLKTTSASNLTLDELISEDLNETKTNETNVSSIDLKEENVFTYQSIETNDSIASEDFSGSGSGEEPIEPLLELTTELDELNRTEDNYSSVKETKEYDNDWKILDFFNTNDNRSDSEIFDEIYNKSINTETNSSLDQMVVQTANETQITTELIPELNSLNYSSSQTTLNPLIDSMPTKRRTRISFFKSATRAKCETFNQTMCVEWSTDRLLRARLCCLTEVLADDESGFGCGHFERSKCHRMLPLIKCCLKDFSQLLDNYFQSIRVNSQQKMRN